MSITVSSRIVSVSVHARGAIVTRAVELPATLPTHAVDLVVGELTPLSEAGSLRAEVSGARQVVSVVSALRFPTTTARPGASVERVAELLRRQQRLSAERSLLEARLAQLRSLQPVPPGRLRSEKEAIDARFADALATSSLVNDVAQELDERVAALDVTARQVAHELQAAQLDDAQRASAERMGAGHPMREVTVRLDGGASIDALTLSYVVPAARWWPTYTLRLSDGGTRASWWLEALVAQGSGEDWKGARLALATADLVRDARLPELPSLRLGRAQPPPKKAYRAAPEGLERMFAAYDESRGPFGAPPPTPPPPQRPGPLPPPPMAAPAAAPMMAQAAPKPSVVGGVMPAAPARGGGMADMARAKKRSSLAMGGMAPPSVSAPSGDMTKEGAAAAYDEPPDEPPAPTAVEPADAWLDFDALSLAGLGEARRGRLALAPAPTLPSPLMTIAARIDALTPAQLRDPRDSRGLFDHRYDAAGVADIPSDGALHRITVGIAEAPSQLRWKTVPRQAAEVYKEARLTNPFASPLLAGPVDVFVEGSLLLTSDIERIDAGGTMTIGLGVEDRIRVARNARVDESTAGLLGGGVVVDSEVTIDLTSSLSREAVVEVLDRIPVSDDGDLEVQLVSSKPEAASYKQEERGAPIRKGLRWQVTLPAAGKSKIVFRYKLSFSGKSEIVGGNRRE